MTALDGVRGVAAAVVVVHHVLLTWPALSAQYGGPDRGSATWLLAYSPLHLAWAGREAVTVFFILSGFVLVLPYLTGRGGGSWTGYLVRRLLRLYPPVAASLVLAAVLIELFGRTPRSGATAFAVRLDVEAPLPVLAHDLLLVDGTSMVNGVLWSLQHEVVFSLLLPVVVLAARRLPSRLVLTLPAALALVLLGQFAGSPYAQWLPVFLVGVALVTGREDLQRLADAIEASPLRRALWLLLATAATGLLLAEWVLRAFGVAPAVWLVASPPLVAAGGALTCFLALGCPAVRRACSGALLQWAGRISFSLYLVHTPVVLAVAARVQPGFGGTLITLVVGGGLSIAVAVGFCALVEGPSQRWSRSLGRAIDRRWGRRRSAPSEAPIVPSRDGLPATA